MGKNIWIILILLCLLLTGCAAGETIVEAEHIEETSESIAETDYIEETSESITEVDRMEAESPEYDRVPDAVFCGSWYGRSEDREGHEMALMLTLEPDGYAAYSYGLPYSDILEKYEGSWSAADTQLVLELKGGPVATEGQEGKEETGTVTGIFEWELYGWALNLKHAEGNSLLYDMEGMSISLLPFDPYPLAGIWETNEEDTENGGSWFYELKLYENAECTYEFRHSEGIGWASYEGWWSINTDQQVELSLMLREGEALITPEGEPLFGTYETEFVAQDDVILRHVSGTKLTRFMEETGWEEFWR